MPNIGSTTPSTNPVMKQDRRSWWFTWFTPTVDIVINELWCYCGQGTWKMGNLQFGICNNTWVNNVGYTTLCYKNTGDMFNLGWSWRGGTASTQITLTAGITYNWFFRGSSGYSDSEFCYSGALNGTSGNISGVSFVSNYWDPHNPPSRNYNYLPCIYAVYTPVNPPGPALKIEGTTPGKLEYTSWSSINTVR
jgi:hypothetical protein